MTAKILDGRAIAAKIKLQVKEKILSEKLSIGLAVI
ncbi:MAG: bifunctional methylenetetrahydrofolate dehydrogenase/methenyltetrahydrofolate cyclohydrolase, partial [Gammaproteobacteria bacterium]|nr:bifunctional methylenetetrahydrofolate dehydrogenase/methenyltetrahydrofolate cyclohydrolase [Gammaproteobacteria bacterium]